MNFEFEISRVDCISKIMLFLIVDASRLRDTLAGGATLSFLFLLPFSEVLTFNRTIYSQQSKFLLQRVQ